MRLDYPALDPPEWRKLLPMRRDHGEVTTGELPLDYHLQAPYARPTKRTTGSTAGWRAVMGDKVYMVPNPRLPNIPVHFDAALCNGLQRLRADSAAPTSDA